ncbi:DUF1801 domain-containing protein [Knoellia aerolata]|uniref:YdhG-like domain-containing protein n=1 Tax=Knoellia aerolata DSM 18566 TaxID=1385519 RepID=A0A0A0K103_9MICO|nr:DUF1801 domain-containing protein [Knoellia aerolata]KGN42684.1 hypothetical protein N801_14215 [Knoellia aerolata DSM 18566]
MTVPAPPDHGDRSTRPNDGDVDAHLATVEPVARREDAQAVLALMREVTGAEPVLWGGSMVGFGRQPYRTADGKEREWFAVGLAARKAALTLYGLTYDGAQTDVLERLGPHTTGKGCLYLKRLSEVDLEVLRELVATAWSRNHTPD